MTGQTISDAVATRQADAISVARQYEPRFAEVLPDNIDAKAFLGLAAGELYQNPALMEAANNSPSAFMNALMRCASLGHHPGTGEFYLTPRYNKDLVLPTGRKGGTQILGIEGYRGIVERMYRSGAVAAVIVREVCEGDRFEFVEGVNDKPVHEIDWFGHRGAMIGVYAYAKLTTGAVSRVVILSKTDVEEIKAKSDGVTFKDGKPNPHSPWNKDERAMWWKSAARRLEPWVPTSAEYRREQLRAAVAADNERRGYGSPDNPGIIDVTTGEILDPEEGGSHVEYVEQFGTAEFEEGTLVGPGEFGSPTQPVPDDVKGPKS